MATVKGIWTFKDDLTGTFSEEEVNFVSNNRQYNKIATGYYAGVPFEALFYAEYGCSEDLEFCGYVEQDVYALEKYPEWGVDVGWEADAYKTIDFGVTEQTVSDGFYAWLTKNTEPRNIEINVTENGTTTLATAGKYCDRNIDVNVNVPSYEAELAEQKAITDSIVLRTIKEYANDTITEIGAYAFGYCQSLHTLDCPKVGVLSATCFQYCSALQRVDFPRVYSIFNNVFANCSKLDTLILRRNDFVCNLKGTNAFTSTPIAKGTGYVYVPDNLVESYKVATNWSAYADQIKPISELGE